MEKKALPNTTLILVFGILSILSVCCCGVFGIIFSVIALILAKKATTLYLENPELYSDYQNVTIGKISAIIGLVLNILSIILFIIITSFNEYQDRINKIKPSKYTEESY